MPDHDPIGALLEAIDDLVLARLQLFQSEVQPGWGHSPQVAQEIVREKRQLLTDALARALRRKEHVCS